MSNYWVALTPAAAWCGITKHYLVSTCYTKFPVFTLKLAPACKYQHNLPELKFLLDLLKKAVSPGFEFHWESFAPASTIFKGNGASPHLLKTEINWSSFSRTSLHGDITGRLFYYFFFSLNLNLKAQREILCLFPTTKGIISSFTLLYFQAVNTCSHFYDSRVALKSQSALWRPDR